MACSGCSTRIVKSLRNSLMDNRIRPGVVVWDERSVAVCTVAEGVGGHDEGDPAVPGGLRSVLGADRDR